MKEKDWILGEQVIASAQEARDAADKVLECPWWRPIRRAALVRDMRIKRREMRRMYTMWQMMVLNG